MITTVLHPSFQTSAGRSAGSASKAERGLPLLKFVIVAWQRRNFGGGGGGGGNRAAVINGFANLPFLPSFIPLAFNEWRLNFHHFHLYRVTHCYFGIANTHFKTWLFCHTIWYTLYWQYVLFLLEHSVQSPSKKLFPGFMECVLHERQTFEQVILKTWVVFYWGPLYFSFHPSSQKSSWNCLW